MIPKLIKIVSLLLLYVTPPPPTLDHFMSLHLSRSNSILVSTFTAATTTTIIPTKSSSHCLYLCSSVSVIAAVFVSMFPPTFASSSTGSLKWSPRHVDTKLGVVQGYIVYPNGFDGVEVLLNMPYASPPLGNLRFMPPVSGSPWSGVRRSERPSPVCPQVLPDIRNESEALKSMPKGRLIQLQRLLPHLKNQSEDCLYLNLYVPLKVAEGRIQEKLPVLVFINGDDYSYGGGHPYDPSMLVSFGNIIVVNLNYRLGILGFLNANSDSHFRLPYNFALLDQIAALQWIQENIALFGGDRFNVTLMGHGKGAVLVNFLMISSAVPTGLLFHRVILSSGSALSPLTSDLSSGPEMSRRFATRVRCPPEPSSTMLECLREVPVRLFLESELWSLFGPSGDGIVVKNEIPSDNVIMNKASHYPLLFGAVKMEALPSLSNHDATYGMENERRRELLRQFINKHYRFHRNEILAGAIHEYTDWEKPVQHPQNVREETLDALADAQVVAPMTKVGDLHSQSSRSRAYYYSFEYQSKSSDYQQRLGCVHAEDLLYVFGVPLYFYDYDSADSESSSPEMMRSDISGGDYVSVPIASSQLPQPEKVKVKDVKRRDELGFFTGNFTWYEVQLSLTVMRLWVNFIRVGNPNEDTTKESAMKGRRNWAQQPPLGKVETGTGGTRHRSFGSGSPSGHGNVHVVGVDEDGSEFDSDSNNRLGHKTLRQKQQGSTTTTNEQQFPDPIDVEWPQYESLDKKYLVLDLRPRIKSHYRAHKLSFWLHLVPDYQKNDEGTSITSIHHGIIFTNVSNNNNKLPPHHGTTNKNDPHIQSSLENLSKVSVIPSPSFASGLYDLSQGSHSGTGGVSQTHPHNSSSPNSPKLSPELPGGGIHHQNDPKEQQDSGENHISNIGEEESTFGFQTYSTALSVTICVGCSLLILNILIFATFYYEREKRLNALRQVTSNSGSASGTREVVSHSHQQQEHPQLLNQRKDKSLPCTSTSPRLQHQHCSTLELRPVTSSSSSTLRSLKRRKENGGVGIGMELAMQKSSMSTYSSYYMDIENCDTLDSSKSYFSCNVNDERFGNERGSYIHGADASICNTSGAFGDLHLSAYETVVDDAEEDSVRCVTSAATGGEVNYGNYPIKRYSENGSGTGTSSGGTTIMSRNRSRRAINELGMSIDMSESVTNDPRNPNFSPQSSPRNLGRLQIGTTFVGIEGPYLRQQQQQQQQHSPSPPLPLAPSSLCHLRHPPPQLRNLQQEAADNSNSSFEDGQSSSVGGSIQ